MKYYQAGIELSIILLKKRSGPPHTGSFILAINSISICLGYSINTVWHKVVSKINDQQGSHDFNFWVADFFIVFNLWNLKGKITLWLLAISFTFCFSTYFPYWKVHIFYRWTHKVLHIKELIKKSAPYGQTICAHWVPMR